MSAHDEDAPPSTDDFLNGIWKENPVLVQVLGNCPTLAVTNTVRNAIAMGLATLVVLVMSNALISAIRKFIPKEVRMASYILVIATLVSVVDYAIQAISLELHRALGAFIALIVVNCIILGRAEAFASKHGVVRSTLDGLGMGLGFFLTLLLLGVVRETLGSGSLLGHRLFGAGFEPWVILVLPSGGFFTFASWLLFFNWRKQRRGAAPPAAPANPGAEGAR
jgi:electron transport complex protein RnfE